MRYEDHRGGVSAGVPHDPVECSAAVSELAQRLTAAEDHVRRTIAEGIHDDLGQLLAAVRLHLHDARTADVEPARKDALEEADRLVGEAALACRKLTFDLLSPALPEARMDAELEGLVRRLEAEFGVTCSYTSSTPASRLSRPAAIAVLRAVREILFNVAVHAEAQSAQVTVSEENGRLRVSVADDGRGMELPLPPPSSAGGFGLLIASERLRKEGGGLEVRAAPGAGTEVVVLVPFEGGSPA